MTSNEYESSGNVKETVFTDVTSYTDIDPLLVNGILRCVPSSGMKTTDDDTLHHINGDIVTVYTDDAGEVMAFSSTFFGSPNVLLNSSEISDQYGCYLAGATIAKEHQNKGFYKKMNQKRIGAALERNLDLIFTRTQNPRVKAGIESVLADLQAKQTISGYELEQILIPGCYGHMLTEEKPQTNNDLFNKLDYEKGDAFVLLYSLIRGV